MSKENKLTEVQKLELDKKAEKCALDFREKFNLGDEPISDIFSLDFTKEFLLLKFPNEMGISGAYIEKAGRENSYKCIYINTNEPIGRQNFSFAHELYHRFHDKSNDVLSVTNASQYDPVEYCADCFASHLLIPRMHLKKLLLNIKGYRCHYYISKEELFDLQKIYGVSFQSLVYTISKLDNKSLVPKNINSSFAKYYNEKYWEELKQNTERYDKDNLLNSVDPVFEWPRGFRENIEKNLSEGLVSHEDVEDIYDFFEM
jgi:Zn-dependent peptidase ImmA (M78 family)